MPTELKRFHHSGQSHFVTFTCYWRLPHLQSAKACENFVLALERARLHCHFRVYRFVAMPEHVQLLISEPERGTVANAIQSLKISSAKRSAGGRERMERHTPLWQKRYDDRNVRDYDEFVEKLRYIHRNPVKRALVEKAEDWRWSSFRHYALREDCGVEIESQWTADRRNKRDENAHSPH
ncbi:MAG: REP-associated tyrosine transposase [Acidobacteriaceae bacterium]